MNRNLNPNQLKMFMTSGEIKEQTVPIDAGSSWRSPSSVDEMWAEKREENNQRYNRPLSDAGPVTIQHNVRSGTRWGVSSPGRWEGDRWRSAPMLWDGHHRVQAAEDQGGEVYLPVRHVDDSSLPGAPSPLDLRTGR